MELAFKAMRISKFGRWKEGRNSCSPKIKIIHTHIHPKCMKNLSNRKYLDIQMMCITMYEPQNVCVHIICFKMEEMWIWLKGPTGRSICSLPLPYGYLAISLTFLKLDHTPKIVSEHTSN